MSRFADNDPAFDETEDELEDADEAENQADALDEICPKDFDGN